jgi:hypothetical protein
MQLKIKVITMLVWGSAQLALSEVKGSAMPERSDTLLALRSNQIF